VDGPLRTEHRKIFAVVRGVVATFAVISLLWLLRTHYFNATNAGWGDREQDRHQWLLGWAVRISFALAVICVSAVATFSKRVLIAITVGTALSLSSALVASWLPMVSFVLGFPAWWLLYTHLESTTAADLTLLNCGSDMLHPWR